MPASDTAASRRPPALPPSIHPLDLETLLQQTEGKGIHVYTHGEMLPAHGYPGIKKYGHLAGHVGTAWQNQQSEFNNLPAAILFTTNCIQQPQDSYRDRTFTNGLVAWPGVAHVANRDFTPVIQKALALEGFRPTEDLFLVGGCDGARPGRNYYTDPSQDLAAILA